MSFNLFINGDSNLWDKEFAKNVLAQVINNPFGEFDLIEIDYSNDFIQLDFDTALRELLKPSDNGLAVGFRLGTDNPFAVDGVLSHSDRGSGISIFIDDENIEKSNLKDVKNYLQEWRNILPEFSWAGAIADDRDDDFFYRRLKIPPVPKCIGNTLGWFHVLSPIGYEPFFKREDLLVAPAYKIEEFEDGTIGLMTYPHPLEYGTEENTQRLIELTQYLYQKWREHSPLPESLTNPTY